MSEEIFTEGCRMCLTSIEPEWSISVLIPRKISPEVLMGVGGEVTVTELLSKGLFRQIFVLLFGALQWCIALQLTILYSC